MVVESFEGRDETVAIVGEVGKKALAVGEAEHDVCLAEA